MNDEVVGETPEKIWVRFDGLVGTKFSATIERITEPAVQPDEDSNLWGRAIEYVRADSRPSAPAPELLALREALIWCSGSSDFAPEGKAREGWLKLCAPLLADPITQYTKGIEERRAKARLIAAAPALYEALVAVVAIADRKTVEFDGAHAALALANGQDTATASATTPTVPDKSSVLHQFDPISADSEECECGRLRLWQFHIEPESFPAAPHDAFWKWWTNRDTSPPQMSGLAEEAFIAGFHAAAPSAVTRPFSHYIGAQLQEAPEDYESDWQSLLFDERCKAITLQGQDYWAIPRDIYDQLRAAPSAVADAKAIEPENQ